MLAPSPSHSKSNIDGQNRPSEQSYRFRCPSCKKLYAVDAHKVQGPVAEFECIKCFKHFAFKLPAGGYSLVPTYSLDPEPNKKPVGIPIKNVTQQIHGSCECPKCGATNSTKDSECWRCQVVLAKVKDLPLELGRNASPAVVSLWKQVLEAIDKPALHNIFIKECTRRKQLSYAIDRYSQLCEAQPHDTQLAAYLVEVERLKASQELKERSSRKIKVNHLLIMKYLIFLPLVIGAVIVLIGLSYSNLRNLVGLGAAILFLYGGVLFSFYTPKKRANRGLSPE